MLMLTLSLQCREDSDSVAIEPVILSSSGQFVQGFFVDTLRITFTFADGDGDVGLDFDNPQHKRHPYERSFYYLKSTGERISSDKLDDGEVTIADLITYEDRHTPPFDTLPALSNCKYEPISDNAQSIEVYRTENPDHWNFEVRFFEEETPGNFVRRTWPDAVCGPFYGLIPTKSHPIFRLRDLGSGRKEVIYSFVGSVWSVLFQDTRVQLELQIKDRALHVSKPVKTPPFDSF